MGDVLGDMLMVVGRLLCLLVDLHHVDTNCSGTPWRLTRYKVRVLTDANGPACSAGILWLAKVSRVRASLGR
jgi:hypothetical protein